jgi:tetratricopeptide (TPR) repeat protein
VLEKIPFLLLSALFAGVTLYCQDRAQCLPPDYPTLDRFLQPGYRAWFYVWKTVVPLGLSPLYPLEHVPGWFSIQYLASGAFLLGVTIAAWTQRWCRPWFAAAWFSYLILLSPVAGMIHAGPQQVADRYSYLPGLAFAALAAGAFAWGWGRHRTASVAAAVLLLGSATALTVSQCGVWKNSMTLWNRVLELAPESAVGHNNRGLARWEAGDRQGALEDVRAAMRLDAGYWPPWAAMGLFHAEQGRFAQAVEAFTHALKLNPGSYETMFNRGSA